MIKSMEALYKVLSGLNFDYHVRAYPTGAKYLVIFCNRGEEDAFRGLYALIAFYLLPVLWEEGGLLKIRIPVG